MLTALLLLIPFLGSGLTLFTKGKTSAVFAMLVSLAQLVVALVMVQSFQPDGGMQFETVLPWIPQLGATFHLGIDGISLIMVLLASVATPLIVASQFGRDIPKSHRYNALILFMQGAMTGVFLALDGLLYYLFWELALLPILFIMLGWGEGQRQAVTLKFFIYTLAGSLFMLVGFLLLYFQSATGSFAHSELSQLTIDNGLQQVIFALLFVAFAIKMPMFPFHSWQPSTYTSAPTQGTMLLSGIMLKMGIYSVLRWIIPIVPEAVETHTPLIIALSITGVVYGAWIAIKQKDLKTLFAFASMSHVGLIVAGLFTASESGLQGVLFQSFSHGINAIGLFYVADIVQNRFGNRTIDGKGGIRLAAPVFATLFVLVLLGTVALPLTNGFAGEFLLLVGISEYSIAASAVAGLTVIFSAVYMLRSYQHLVLGPAGTQTAFSDLRLTEMVILAVIVVAIFALGVYPKALLDLSAPTIQTLLNR